MKKIIIMFLLTGLVAFSGCNEDEVIELYEQETMGEGHTEDGESASVNISDSLNDISNSSASAKKNKDEMTGDSETNSRSFVVYVCGEVIKPGVYELEEGSRLIDAIDKAGGYTENASQSSINLASLLSDEQMIYVPSVKEVEEAGVAGVSVGIDNKNASKGQENNLINLNTATKEDLMTLPGIGESKADKIISYRDENGGFKSPEGIMQISGIKDGLYNKIKDRICVK